MARSLILLVIVLVLVLVFDPSTPRFEDEYEDEHEYEKNPDRWRVPPNPLLANAVCPRLNAVVLNESSYQRRDHAFEK